MIVTTLGFLARCCIETTSIDRFAGVCDNDRQAIYMRSLLSKLRKGRGNFPLIFARLHSGPFDIKFSVSLVLPSDMWNW